MTLVVLIGGLAAKDTERKFIIIAFIPIIVFWLLNTYYLRLECQYRILYKTVTKKCDDEIDFSMDLSQIQNMSISDSKKICSLIEEIDKLLKKVEKRVQVPIGFWKTIIGAFGDMFRKRQMRVIETKVYYLLGWMSIRTHLVYAAMMVQQAKSLLRQNAMQM